MKYKINDWVMCNRIGAISYSNQKRAVQIKDIILKDKKFTYYHNKDTFFSENKKYSYPYPLNTIVRLATQKEIEEVVNTTTKYKVKYPHRYTDNTQDLLFITNGPDTLDKIIKNKKDLPEKWVVQGEYDIGMYYNIDILNKNWYFKLTKNNKKNIGFYKGIYYNKERNNYKNIPKGYTLVTKEQLLEHYNNNINTNLNFKENEKSRIIKSERDKSIRGKCITSSRTRQVTVAGRLIGNKTSAKYKRKSVKGFEIKSNTISY